MNEELRRMLIGIQHTLDAIHEELHAIRRGLNVDPPIE